MWALVGQFQGPCNQLPGNTETVGWRKGGDIHLYSQEKTTYHSWIASPKIETAKKNGAWCIYSLVVSNNRKHFVNQYVINWVYCDYCKIVVLNMFLYCCYWKHIGPLHWPGQCQITRLGLAMCTCMCYTFARQHPANLFALK